MEPIENIDRVYFVRGRDTHCGDKLCMLTAAMEFAEKMDAVVYVDFFDDVVKDLNHSGVRFSKTHIGTEMYVWAAGKHRNKKPGLFVNILGTYLAEFGLPIVDPVLRLPVYPDVEPRVLIQPFSRFASNPPVGYIQRIVDEFTELTGMTPFMVGTEKTPRTLSGVDYSLLKTSIPFLMQQVRSAICVLTPRSLAANVAAAYGRPTFMWSPSDGEDWHLDYRGWRHITCNFDKKPDPTSELIRKFVEEFGFKKKDQVLT